MSINKNLISLKVASGKNYPAIKYIINLFNLKSNTWQDWKNNHGDALNVFDDGQKINYKFSFQEINDILQFCSLKDILNYSNTLIAIKRKNILKVWLFGHDKFVRLFEFNNDWKMKHLFSESAALTMHMINMFLGYSDDIPKLFQIDDFIVLISPFDSLDTHKDNNNFNQLWKELGV